MYHIEKSGPIADSIAPATKAYTETDGMKYRQIPFSYRIAQASNFEDCQPRLREPDPGAFLFSPFDSREKNRITHKTFSDVVRAGVRTAKKQDGDDE